MIDSTQTTIRLILGPHPWRDHFQTEVEADQVPKLATSACHYAIARLEHLHSAERSGSGPRRDIDVASAQILKFCISVQYSRRQILEAENEGVDTQGVGEDVPENPKDTELHWGVNLDRIR